jgi:uncharacterized protein (TIGR03546 family)
MLEMLAKLLKALNSDRAPGQISSAFVFAMIIGFTPTLGLHSFVLLLLVLILRVHLASFIVAFGLFSGLAYLLDPLFNDIGYQLLTRTEWQAFWTELYQSTAWRVTRFNNTTLLGSLVVSTALALPLFFLSNWLIKKYRERFLVWINKSKMMQVLRANKFYQLIAKANEVREAI